MSNAVEEYQPPRRKTRWVGVILFTSMTLGSLIAPFYIYYNPLTTTEIVLFWVYFLATSFSITVGYHRLFAHATYKAHPIIQFLLLFFGAATYEQSAIKWSSQHRQHHQFTDTDLDPHDSTKGFWYCHVGWIIFYKHVMNRANVKDLFNSPLILNQHRYYNLWAFTSGILIPMLIGYAIGKPLSVFIVCVMLRMFLVINTAFLINSYAHMVGSNAINPKESARDHWLGAIITNGEGYHSFHHKFPNDYRNGYMWYHYDPTKWIIFLLSKIGLASDLKRTPERLMQAALESAAAYNQSKR